MSIIQEALKKAHYNFTQRKIPQAIVKVKKTRSFFIPSYIYLVVIFAITLGIALNSYSFSKSAAHRTINSNKSVKVEPRLKKFRHTLQDMQKSKEAIKNFILSNTVINKTPEFVLNGIMYLSDRPKAIINSSVVQEGDSVDGATVKAINQDNVHLVLNNEEITIKLQ